MKVLIISGFLGAGKTTFLTRLVRRMPDVDFAVLENEFGETDIDAKIIGQDVDSLKIWELTENCVCCTGKADFLTNLLTISSAVDPDVLLVEPTGVAKLGNLIRNIEGLHYDRVRMLHPVTIVDAHAFLSEKESYDAICLDQIAHSDTLVLSKSEQMTEDELEPCLRELRKYNGHAEIVTGDYDRREDAWWHSLLTNLVTRDTAAESGAADGGHAHAHHDHGGEETEELRTVTLHDVSLPSPVHLLALLQEVAEGRFGSVPRAKGCLPCHTPGEWIRFDLVDKGWMISGFPAQPEATVTFIGRGLDETTLKQRFKP